MNTRKFMKTWMFCEEIRVFAMDRSHPLSNPLRSRLMKCSACNTYIGILQKLNLINNLNPNKCCVIYQTLF